MKIALIGGTGFMGYNFARRMLSSGDVELVVYGSSPKSLVNLARHAVNVRLVAASALRSETVDPDTDFIVNYAHPFSQRDGLSRERQLQILLSFLIHNLQAWPRLRLIHISSMSVYEPFAPGVEFEESACTRPPRTDVYARGKHEIERGLKRKRALRPRILILRPTVVYGPYCRPWTDNLMTAFSSGDVPVRDLNGRIQPIYVDDVTSFVEERLAAFEAGTFNLAGPDTVRWRDFFEHFSEVTPGGRLVTGRPLQEPAGWKGMIRESLESARRLGEICLRDPAFGGVRQRLRERLPPSVVELLRRRLLADPCPSLSHGRDEGTQGPYCSPFFAQDRIVSKRKCLEHFGEPAPTRLGESKAVLERYFQYRFTDAVLSE